MNIMDKLPLWEVQALVMEKYGCHMFCANQFMNDKFLGDTTKYKVKFDDPRVCKSFLLACCPHDILSSTRMDLGECPKIHDLALRADYEWATKKKDYYYDIDAMEHLQSFIADCDRKTEMAKRRLKETQEELSEEANQKAEKIHQLGEKLGENMAKAETMGAEGEVEESLKLMEEVEELKKNKSLAEQDYRNSMPASSYQQQKLRVCEVCSAYLGIHDNDRRLADHFGGKLHLGFITIREKLEELKTRVAERRNLREKEREEQKVKREKEDEPRKSKSASPVRRRSRSTSKRSRSRSRSRRKSRSRSQSRERNRRRRSHSSSRNRRRSRSSDRRSHKRSRHSRSRSRSRRSRSRRSRSRRSRSRRSRSRSRSRSHRHRRRSRSRSRRSRSRSRSRRHRHRSRSGSRRSRSAERRRDSRSRSRDSYHS